MAIENLTRMAFVPSNEVPANADAALGLAAMYESMGTAVLDAAATAAPEDQARALVTATRLDTRAQQLLNSAVNQDSATRRR